MTFKEMYQESKEAPKRFIETVMQKTGVSEMTVRCWLSGTQVPSKPSRNHLEELFNTTYEELFPHSSK